MKDLRLWRFIGKGYGIHWPKLDEDISGAWAPRVAGLAFWSRVSVVLFLIVELSPA